MNYKHFLYKLFLVAILISIFSGCFSGHEKKLKSENEIIIFHAGSLAVPFKQLADSFQNDNPGIKVLLEGAGSRECARKISELHRPCDIIATSDYTVIEDLLMPTYTKWYVDFATNEMCIAYLPSSRYSNTIDAHNWRNILRQKDVIYGRSDPDLDPCGYRTIITLKLSDQFYDDQGLADSLMHKDQEYIRPKETDLVALLESHTVDYIFIYRSVAEQHQLKYISLPIQINLSKPALGFYYGSVSVKLPGKNKGETILKSGESMVYAVSILNDAPDKENALKFVQFLLSDKGARIIEANHQPAIRYAKPGLRQYIPPLINEMLNKETKP